MQSISRPIPGFDGRYSATEDGEIFSHIRNRLLSRFTDKGGYQIVQMTRPGDKSRSYRVHRMIALAFIGDPTADAYDVRHMDGNPANNRPSNLKYGNDSENSLDTIRHGTHPQASKTHCRRGHILDGPSVEGGRRECIVCRDIRGRARGAIECTLCGKAVHKAGLARHKRTHESDALAGLEMAA